MEIRTGILKAEETRELREQMWNLYEHYYRTDPQSFQNRFGSNDFYAVYKAGEKLVGFTGLRMRTVETPHGKAETLYIGQTVLHADYRGKSIIPRTCVSLIARHYITHPRRPLYVWCDSLTYKPYMLFARSVRKYYPNRHEALPEKVSSVLHQLGKHYYGELYAPLTGTVRKPAYVIADPTTVIRPADRQDPDIDFYARANPHYLQGHGLLTIAPMNFTNFLHLVYKCIKKITKR